MKTAFELSFTLTILMANLNCVSSFVSSAIHLVDARKFLTPTDLQTRLTPPIFDLHYSTSRRSVKSEYLQRYSSKKSGSNKLSIGYEGNRKNNSSSSLHIGAMVEVQWDGEWWPAVVTAVDSKKQQTKVRFCDSSALDEEWTKQENIRIVRTESFSRLESGEEVYSEDEIQRADVTPDEAFWAAVGGGGAADMDPDFLDLLIDLHSSLLPAGGRFLDLCTGSRSALPPAVEQRHVEGIGLVRAQLQRNAWLDSWSVADLNAAAPPSLPPASFDAVICAGALPYLLRPLEVLRAARQALRPAGVLAVR